MKLIEKNLSFSELADIKNKKKKLRKKVISDSIIIGILTFFGLILMLLICEKFEIIIPSLFSKPALVGLSVLSGIIYYFKGLYKLTQQENSNRKVSQYTFTITDYYCETISNTEYAIYACKTTDNKTVIFQTSQLPTDQILDTLKIDLLNGKIISIDNYSTGKAVNQIILDKKLIDTYDEQFYLIDKDIYNL